MKQKWKNNKIFQYIISKDGFKLCFLFSICIAVYGGVILTVNTSDIFSAFLTAFSFDVFQALFFALFFYNTYVTITVVNKDLLNYIYRLKSKSNYVKSVIGLSVLSNLYLLLLFLLVFLTAYNFLGPGISFNSSINLGYFIFFFARFFVILILLCICMIYLYLSVKNKLYIVIAILFLMLLLSKDSLRISQPYLLIPFSLLDATIVFPNIQTEAFLTVLFILFLAIILLCFYTYIKKSRRFDIL